jgi:hypothetical protein
VFSFEDCPNIISIPIHLNFFETPFTWDIHRAQRLSHFIWITAVPEINNQVDETSVITVELKITS